MLNMTPGNGKDAVKRTKRSTGESQYRTEGVIFGNLDPVQHDSNIDPTSNACYNCWSFRHKQSACTQTKTRNYCCNCGRRGVTVDACPRCARPFQGLRVDLKDWICRQFCITTTLQADHIEQTGQAKVNEHVDEKWDINDKDVCWSYCSRTDSEYGKIAGDQNTSNEYKYENVDWMSPKSYCSRTTVYAEPNHVFSHLRDKKIQDEFETDEINNAAENLDETRMAETDSFGENSIISMEDSIEKNKEMSRLTGEPLGDFLQLLNAVKHLSVKTQDVVVLQFMSERKKLMVENEMQSIKKSKTS